MTEPPAEVAALAERRAAARAARDFAGADALRTEIESRGWLVRDVAAGWELSPKPLGPPPERSCATRRASLAILVEGWPEDVERCVAAALRHTPDDVGVLLLDLAGVDLPAGPRIEAWRGEPGWTWARARTALQRADPAGVHVWLDPSVEMTGDCVTPLLDAIDAGAVAAGGWGVDPSPDLASFEPAPYGEAGALLGYLLAMRRDLAEPDPRARFYRNADLELSLALREHGPLVSVPLPATLHRHRGYHDTDPAYRDRESRRNYERVLRRLRDTGP